MAPVFVHFIFFFIFKLFSSGVLAAASCDQCNSRVTYFANSSGLSAGACGYGPYAVSFYGEHVAAAVPKLFGNGFGCGACYQIRCKQSKICSQTGTKVVLTDLHTDKSNTATDFVLSSRAYRGMALPGKDKILLGLGIVDVEYQRVPCVYNNKNLTLLVEGHSKPPYYLAIKILYQGGQADIPAVEVARVGEPVIWVPMTHNYGAVWDTSKVPKGALQFRFNITSGKDAQYFYTKQVLPANWNPGSLYYSTVQVTNVANGGCTRCSPY